MKIEWLDDPVPEYQKGVHKAPDQTALIEHISKYMLLAHDALECAIKIKDWSEFKTGLNKEHQKEFAGEEWADKYGEIILPEVMIQVSLLAEEFKVPFGVIYHRLFGLGMIRVKNDIAIWIGDDS